jgi:hypothetical protein
VIAAVKVVNAMFQDDNTVPPENSGNNVHVEIYIPDNGRDLTGETG